MTRTSIFGAAVGLLSCAIASCSGDQAGSTGGTDGTGGTGAGLDTTTVDSSATTVDGSTTTADGSTTAADGPATSGGPTTTGAMATTDGAETVGSTATTSDSTTSTTASTSTTDASTSSTSSTDGGASTTSTTDGSAGSASTNDSTEATTTTSTTDGAGGAGSTSNTDTTDTTTTSTTGSVDDGTCMTPPDPPTLVGWATEGGGTVGGGNATPTVVTSTSELNSAASGSDARVIYVNGSLSGNFTIGSNKTIVGICGAELQGSVGISNQQNVILRNLKVVGYNCSDSPQDCSSGHDAIGVHTSHNLWFDHLDVSDGSDGNLDITNNSDYVTISWTKFSYSTPRTDPSAGASGHRFSNLIGASDSDSGGYRITFHHDWWAQNVDQRMPRTRFGDIHVFNNLFTSSGNGYCTNSGYSTHVLVENNIYRGVHNPLSPDSNGDMHAVGNVFDNTSGNTSDNGGVGFNPPYDYQLDPTSGLDTVLQAEVGPHD